MNQNYTKSRDITLPPKVRLVKAMVFPVVMYGCESWTIRELSTEELMLLNCGVGEDSESPLDCKEIQHHSSKASILLRSAFPYSPTLTSIHDHWENHSLDWMDLCWQSNISAF